VEFRILGPVEVWNDGVRLPSLPPKPSQILAVLAVECGRSVTVDRLIDLIWGEAPPPQARKSLQVHISNLRRSGVPVEHRQAGYVLAAPPESVDLHVFRALVAKAGEAAEPTTRSEVYARALALWRGMPLAGMDCDSLRDWLCHPLEAQRLSALEAALDTDLALGRHAEVVDALTALVGQYPLAERPRHQLMKALFRCGRRTDAMRVFREARRTLVDELGVEPGPELQQLYREILGEAQAAPTVRRNYLPRDVGDFTGRAEELAELTLAGADAGVWWIEGSAGVGKSALAVHAAHELAARYPDGQLYVDLHALSADCAPTAPGAALDTVLRAMDVPSERIPAGVDERAALWRAQLTGRRVLIVLDNVAGVAQVRPLLPGTPGCLTLITSRGRLCGLEGVRRLPLEVLPPTEAVTLLARILGDERVNAEPEAAEEVARLCGHLPLAVRITGARLAGRAHWPVSKLVCRLRDERKRLDELVADDLAVRSSLELTYRALDVRSRRAYRMFGFLGYPELPCHVPAALLDVPVGAAEEVLDGLVDARLLDVVGNGRYRMHELVRIHARELAEQEDCEADLLAAVDRVVTAWLSSVDGFAEQLAPAVPRMQDALGVANGQPGAPLDRDEWFGAEEPLLIKTVERAAELGLVDQACRLAEALVFAWFGLRNRYDGWERTHRAALAAVVERGDRRLEAVLRCSIGQMHYKRDHLSEAGRWFDAARRLFTVLADRRGEAVSLNGSGMVARDEGRFDDALTALSSARVLLSELGDAEGVAHALYGVGSVQRDLARDDDSFGTLHDAVDAYRTAHSSRGEALAIRGIGLVHRARGELDQAAELCERAHGMVAAIGDPLLSSYTGQSLAKVLLRQGNVDLAESMLVAAREGCLRLGDRFGLALVRRTMGELHLAGGDPEGARVALREALADWTEMDLVLWRARTLRDLGAAHAGLGDDEGADRCWSEAALVFGELGTRELGEIGHWSTRWGLART
jgi:DNA-binding SARP family transcriptional activator/tetratricopeptide (TPR) repeat protein